MGKPFSTYETKFNHRMTETIQSKEQWVLHRLEGFYSKPENIDRIRGILTGESKISLRLMDWLVTNYAKKNNVSYITNGGNRHVIVYLAYKSHLKAYSKKMFDPFCRSKRITFHGMDTTVGQLNFFEWAIQDEVLDYLEANYDDVHMDMEETSQSIIPKKIDGRRKRHELSRSATKTISRHDVCVTVRFD